MELLLLLYPAAFLGILALAVAQGRRRTAAWRGAAQRGGLTGIVEKKRLGSVVAVEGLAGPFRVRIDQNQRGNHRYGTRITVFGSGHIPNGLDLRADGLVAQMSKVLGAKEIEVGDPDFDERVYARGDEGLLRALCDARTRALLRSLIAMEGYVQSGDVCVGTRRRAPTAESLAELLENALDLGRRLASPEDIVERLAEQVRSDPWVGVREGCLAHLSRAHAEHPTAKAVFREALAMPHPELRLRAAIALGAEGREALLALAMPTCETEARAVRAIKALGKDLTFERAASILDVARSLGLRDAARAVIAALALIPEGDVLSRLLPLALDVDRDLALDAVHALQARADARAEPTLIQLLSSDAGGLRVAAARALASIGSAAAVAPLRAAVDAHALDLDLRGAALFAIATIQTRLPGASPGQLSMAAGEEGQVSLAEKAQGRLALTGEDE